MKMKHLWRTAISVICILTASSCDNRPDEADITFLCTTDQHGTVLPYNYKTDTPLKSSLGNAVTYFKQVRAENPEGTIIFDNGDFLQGHPTVYYYNFVDTLNTHIVSRTYNDVGYDAVSIGNHDIECGEEVYCRVAKELKMPVLCANAIDTRTGKPMFKPYMIIEKKGFKIAVLGLITPAIHRWLPKSLWPHLEFEDMVDCANKWVPEIRKKEKPDLLIGLFHSGWNFAYNDRSIDTRFNENETLPVAVKVPGIDAIFCGHDHRSKLLTVKRIDGDSIAVFDSQTGACHYSCSASCNPQFGDSVVIIDSQSETQMIGRLDIHLTRNKNGEYEKSFKRSIINTTDYKLDDEFMSKYTPALDTIKQYVNSPIGYFSEDMDCTDGLVGPSSFHDLLHDIQFSVTGAEISIAPQLTSTYTIPKGPISMRHLFTIYRYENLLCKVRMTGDEIRRFLEFGYKRQFNSYPTEDGHLIYFKKDSKGEVVLNHFGAECYTPTFNFISAAGIRYVVDLTKPKGNWITIQSMEDGSPFSLEKTYTVAISSYQLCGGGDFLSVGLGWDNNEAQKRVMYSTTRDGRWYTFDFFCRYPDYRPHVRNNWEILPKEWAHRVGQADKELIKAKKPIR